MLENKTLNCEFVYRNVSNNFHFLKVPSYWAELKTRRQFTVVSDIQGNNEVAGQAFLALWAKRTRILKTCKYISKDVYLSFKKC